MENEGGVHVDEIKEVGEGGANTPGFDQMHDIVVPESVSWWPLAPGWWVVLLVLAAVAVWGAVVVYRRWKAQGHRREALRELDCIDPSQYSSLLKRVCMVEFERDEVASLSGEVWLKFLDRTVGGNDFTEGAGRDLLELAYRGEGDADLIKDVVRRWLVGPACSRSSSCRAKNPERRGA